MRLKRASLEEIQIGGSPGATLLLRSERKRAEAVVERRAPNLGLRRRDLFNRIWYDSEVFE